MPLRIGRLLKVGVIGLYVSDPEWPCENGHRGATLGLRDIDIAWMTLRDKSVHGHDSEKSPVASKRLSVGH